MSKDKIATDGKRLLLSSEAFAALEVEVDKLKQKGSHFKLNEARLASVLIEIFCAKYLNKERKQIEARFFDKKTYLKTLIKKSTSEDELSESLDEFFHKSKAKKLKGSNTVEDEQGKEVS